MTVAVVGVGNLLLSDDGLGVHAVRELAQRACPPGVRLIDGGTDPWSAFSEAEGCRALFVLDAVQGGRHPGEFYNLPLDEVEAGGAVMSLHGITLFRLLQYEAVLGNTFEEARLLGMEPECIRPEIGLSPRCRRRLPAFAEMAMTQIGGTLDRLSVS
jgi:hydrogenase maturation protease